MLKNVLKKMSASTLLLLGCQGLLLGAMQIVSQRLGKAGYGQFGLAMSFSVFSAQFILWGMDPLLTFKYARSSADDARSLLGIVLRQKQLAAFTAIFAGTLVALGWPDADERFMIFLGSVDGACLACTMPSIFDARGKTATWQFFAFIRHSIYLGLVLAVSRFFPEHFHPQTVLELHLLCILPELALEQFWVRRNVGIPHWPAPVREAFNLWRESAPMAVAVLAQQLLFNSGLPILHTFGDDAESGGLYLSSQFTTAAASFIAAPAAILHARLALHAHEGPAFRRRVWQTAIPCFVAGIFVSLSYPVVTSAIVRSLFKNLADSAPAILYIDTWRLAPILATIPFASALICLGRLRAFALCHVASALIGVSLSAALVPTYGPRAAACGIALGSCLCFVFSATLVLLDKRSAAPEHTR
ncbi:MAG: hypothetical protein WCT04_02505 [Planctomycetota bacterium]